MVQLSGEKLHRMIARPLPRAWPQTAAAAERVCIPLAQIRTIGKIEVNTDCAGVSTAWHNLIKCQGPGQKWGGVWKQVLEAHKDREKTGNGVKSVEWMRAHTAVEDALTEEDKIKVISNDFADSGAKEMARRSLFCDADLKTFELEAKKLMRIAVATATMLAEWPGLREMYKQELRAPVARQTAPKAKERPHRYTWVANEYGCGKWQCTLCFRTKKARGKQAPEQPCIPARSPMRKLLERDRLGHVLWMGVTAPGNQVILCSRCGRFAESRINKLGHTCKERRETKAAELAHKRFFGQPARHPDPQVKLPLRERPWRAAELANALDTEPDIKLAPVQCDNAAIQLANTVSTAVIEQIADIVFTEEEDPIWSGFLDFDEGED